MRSRVKEIVRAGYRDELDVDVATIAEYKWRVRAAFGLVVRGPLRFPGNLHGIDLQGGSLGNIQARNAPPDFDLLWDDLFGLIDAAGECRLWSDYQDDIEAACSVFDQAREILGPLQRVTLSTRDELQWTAIASRAARSLSCHRSPIFQYADRYGSVLDSARAFWPELKPRKPWKSKELADHEVYALLAADEAHQAVESFLELLQRFDQWADEDDVSDDNEEAFRDEVARWEREEFRYAIRRLAQAKDLQHLAQLANVGADSERARQYIGELEIEVQRRAELLAAAKPMAEKGEAFTRPPVRGLSPLYSIVLGVLNAHGKNMSAEDVWQHLKDCEGGGVIDEISGDKFDGEIFLTGKKRPTTFKAFQTQLSEVRKKVTE